MTPAARAAFIRAETRLTPVPLMPDISLHLASEAMPLWQRTEDELGGIGLPPPFWAFAWAGGQGLARHVLDHPDIVRGKRVLDFAAGSGLLAIAAMRAGAACAEAVDIDAFAIAAIKLNSAHNGVEVTTLEGDIVGKKSRWDVVLAGDISYERDTAMRVTNWLQQMARRGTQVLVGDPGRVYLARGRFDELAVYDVPVSRDLEDCEVKQAGVYQFRAGLLGIEETNS